MKAVSHLNGNGNGHHGQASPSTPRFRVVPKPEAKAWTNHNVLYLDKELDDKLVGLVSYQGFRILLHLQRRVGRRTKKNARVNPGIDSIATTCRLNKSTVTRELRA